MDPAGVLLALEEQRKWRERRDRLRARLRQLQRRKTSLAKELDRARRKVSEFNTLLSNLKTQLVPDRPMTPPPIR